MNYFYQNVCVIETQWWKWLFWKKNFIVIACCTEFLPHNFFLLLPEYRERPRAMVKDLLEMFKTSLKRMRCLFLLFSPCSISYFLKHNLVVMCTFFINTIVISFPTINQILDIRGYFYILNFVVLSTTCIKFCLQKFWYIHQVLHF